ncbi:MAG: ankyrin repeat domain-containing protein [Oligoflexia bacterium]|nr:ankyrin repeat domain-containing protein [Oligoflexia bacterium]
MNPYRIVLRVCLLTFVLLALFTSSLLFGLDFKIHQKADGRIVIFAPTCMELKAEVEAIKLWSKNRDENSLHEDENHKKIVLDCSQKPEVSSVDVTSILPNFVKTFHNKKAKCDGPNCFNAALIEQKLLPSTSTRFSNAVEFYEHTQKYCTLRGAEGPMPGDLGFIKEQITATSANVVHGFTYVGQLCFSKNGLSKKSDYQLQTLKDVMTIYDVDQRQECLQSVQEFSTNCKLYVNYYKCDATKVNNFGASTHTKAIEAIIKEEEEYISTCAFHGIPIVDSKVVSNIFDHVDTISSLNALTSYRSKEQLMLQSLSKQTDYILSDLFKRSLKESNHSATQSILATWESPTPKVLKIASKFGDKESVKKILSSPFINPNESNGALTPLAWAAKRGHLDVAELLLEDFRTNPTAKTSPLLLAAEAGHDEIINLLLTDGRIDPSLTYDGGFAALHFASQNGHEESVKRLLLDPRTKIDQRTDRGLTPLHKAIARGQFKIVQMLVEAGADRKVKDDSGRTPLDWAQMPPMNQSIVDYLRGKK